MVTVMTSESVGGVMVSTLAQNERDVSLITALGAIFPIFITPTTMAVVTRILCKLHALWLLNLPIYVCKVTHYLYFRNCEY